MCASLNVGTSLANLHDTQVLYNIGVVCKFQKDTAKPSNLCVQQVQAPTRPGLEPEGFEYAESTWNVVCHINVQGLEEFFAKGDDRRHGQAQQLLTLAREQGSLSDTGFASVTQARRAKTKKWKRCPPLAPDTGQLLLVRLGARSWLLASPSEGIFLHMFLCHL